MGTLVRAVAFALGSALVFVTWAAVAATDVPGAVFLSTTFDFGKVKQGEKVVHTFTVRNEGTAPLHLKRVDLSETGMSARFPAVVKPNEYGSIRIEWNTAHLKREVEAQAIVRLDDPTRPQVTLLLKGVVTPPIDFLPFPAVFFSIFDDETAQQSVTIVSNEDRPLVITRLEPQGEHFKAALETVEHGKVYKLNVTVPREVAPGRYRETVYLHTNHPTRSRMKIAVNVFVKADLYASWEVIEFGQISLKQLKRDPRLLDFLIQTFTVKKRAGEFTITSIESDVPFLKIKQDPAGKSRVFQIDVGLAMDRIRPGMIDGTIRIRTDDARFPELVVRVRGQIR